MTERDGVDVILEQWRRERPGPRPLADRRRGADLAARARARGSGSSRCTAQHGLEAGWHDVLATLRRIRAAVPACVPAEFAGALMLTSSGTTKRLDRLERAGLIARAPDPEDRRADGDHAHRRGPRGRIDAVSAAHLENERRAPGRPHRQADRGAGSPISCAPSNSGCPGAEPPRAGTVTG